MKHADWITTQQEEAGIGDWVQEDVSTHTNLVATSSVALVETRRTSDSSAQGVDTLSVLSHLSKLHIQWLWDTEKHTQTPLHFYCNA